MNARSYVRTNKKDWRKHEILTSEAQISTKPQLGENLKSISRTIGSITNRRANTAKKIDQIRKTNSGSERVGTFPDENPTDVQSRSSRDCQTKIMVIFWIVRPIETTAKHSWVSRTVTSDICRNVDFLSRIRHSSTPLEGYVPVTLCLNWSSKLLRSALTPESSNSLIIIPQPMSCLRMCLPRLSRLGRKQYAMILSSSNIARFWKNQSILLKFFM